MANGYKSKVKLKPVLLLTTTRPQHSLNLSVSSISQLGLSSGPLGSTQGRSSTFVLGFPFYLTHVTKAERAGK